MSALKQGSKRQKSSQRPKPKAGIKELLGPNDLFAQLSYIEQLPLLAECLTVNDFTGELILIFSCANGNGDLTEKLLEVFTNVIQVFSQEDVRYIIYHLGVALWGIFTKVEFFMAIEELLEKIDDVEAEILLIKRGLGKSSTKSFYLWRAARISILHEDVKEIEQLIESVYDGKVCEEDYQFLSVMRKDLAQRCVRKVFECENRVSKSLIAVIETRELEQYNQDIMNSCAKEETLIDNSEESSKENLSTLLKSQHEPKTQHVKLALESEFLNELLPLLTNVHGVEMNWVNFESLNRVDPYPWELLSNWMESSQEFFVEETLTCLCRLDKEMLLYTLIFPRLGEQKNWRIRFNAIQLLKKLCTTIDWNEDLHTIEYFGFASNMALDPIFAVRKAAMEIFRYLPAGELMTTTLQSLLDFFDANLGEIAMNAKNLLLQTAY